MKHLQFASIAITLLLSFHTITGQIPVSQSELRPKNASDSVYEQLRRQGGGAEDFSAVATVTNLELKRDAATFKFNNGEIYFLTPVEGRVVGAVFLGDMEMTITPPTEAEKRSLALFTGSDEPKPERFNRLVMRFTDQTFQEIKSAAGVQMSSNGSQVARARDAYREIQTLMRKQAHTNVELRTLADIYSPQRQGFFWAFPGGGRFDKLIFIDDPLGQAEISPEQVALYSYSETEGGIWTSFHFADDYKSATDLNAQDHRLFDLTHHEIEGTIRGTRIIATDRVTIRSLQPGIRVLPFNLYRSLRVSHVKDEQGNELSFIQEGKDDDPDFAVILPKTIDAGQDFKLVVQYEGDDAIKDSGGGNFILIPRASWYPNNGVGLFDRATFDITFHYPKDFMFVGVGAPAGPEQVDGDMKIARWTSGSTELMVAAFNYGKFVKKELVDKDTGLGLEFYANKEVPDELKEFQLLLDQLGRDKWHMTGITGNITTSSMADAALTDTENATRIYSAYFGKLPYSRIAMTQQPAFNFGQGWPTLIYMPYTAFIDTTQRTQLMGAQGGSDKFWRYVGPHETSHQWWGQTVGWNSYRDQWMSEGFAEFSTSLFVQYVRKDMAKFHEFWDEQRKMITEATTWTNGRRPYTVGSLSQGFRLDSGRTPNVTRALIYPKGAYVLHMIRMMMFDHRGGGDARFRAMMTDFVHSYFNKNASTDDFKRVVEKHMTPQMDVDKNGRMDWFFDEWVYGTDVPSYKLSYESGSADGKPLVKVHISQSGVSENFRMMVPIYADFGKGWTRLGAARLIGNTSVDIPVPLPELPKKLTICALDDVLYTTLDAKK